MVVVSYLFCCANYSLKSLTQTNFHSCQNYTYLHENLTLQTNIFICTKTTFSKYKVLLLHTKY